MSEEVGERDQPRLEVTIDGHAGREVPPFEATPATWFPSWTLYLRFLGVATAEKRRDSRRAGDPPEREPNLGALAGVFPGVAYRIERVRERTAFGWASTGREQPAEWPPYPVEVEYAR